MLIRMLLFALMMTLQPALFFGEEPPIFLVGLHLRRGRKMNLEMMNTFGIQMNLMKRGEKM